MKIIPVQSITLRTLWGRLRLLVFILLTTLTLTNATSGTAAGPKVVNIRLSGDMPDFSAVDFYTTSPDGAWAVFIADREWDERHELYSVKIWGPGEINRLNGPLINGGNVEAVKVAPNNQAVVYRANQETNNQVELYSASINGKLWVKLNDALSYHVDIEWFQISANSEWVIYRARDNSSNDNLFIVPLTRSSPPVRLNETIGRSWYVIDASFSPDSQHVVYRFLTSGSPTDLYSIHVDGTDRTKLSSTPSDIEGVYGFKITSNSDRVIYRTNKTTEFKTELYSVGISEEGGGIRLHPALDDNTDVNDYKVSPDGKRVVFIANDAIQGPLGLYSAETDRPDGGALVKLNGPLITGGNILNSFEITPNSMGVVFLSEAYREGSFELFSHYIDRPGPAFHLNPTLDSGESVAGFAITPNSLGVVYNSDHQSAGNNQLYSVYTAGPGDHPHQLTNIPDGFWLGHFQISPNGQGVLFSIEPLDWSQHALFSVPITGGSAPMRWSVPIQNPDDYWWDPVLLPDSQSIVYPANPVLEQKRELYFAFWGYQFYLPSISK